MEYKTWLAEGYCPIDHYHCLMPVEYGGEKAGDFIQSYEKQQMKCRHVLDGTCKEPQECSLWKESPQTLDKDTIWYEG